MEKIVQVGQHFEASLISQDPQLPSIHQRWCIEGKECTLNPNNTATETNDLKEYLMWLEYMQFLDDPEQINENQLTQIKLLRKQLF